MMRIGEGQGPYVPVHTGFARFLPKGGRKYSEIEAAYCVQLDYDRGNTVTVSGYAKQWGWSRDKVTGFLADFGASILYDENTSQKQNQRGKLVLQIPLQMSDRLSADGRQINFINNRCLPGDVSRSSADVQQNTGRSSVTTKERLKKEEGRGERKTKPLTPEAMRLSGMLADLILENNPNNIALRPERRDGTIEGWAAHIDKLNRLDGQPWGQIEAVVRWSQQDDFWQANILSGGKLRSKFDQLQTKMAKDEEAAREERRRNPRVWEYGS